MYKSYAIECVGVIFFMYIALTVGQPIPIGLALTLLYLLKGKNSGGGFNPATTLAHLLHNTLSIKEALGFIFAQIIGVVITILIIKNV